MIVQAGASFVAELLCLGIAIPDDIVELVITCNADEPVRICTAKQSLGQSVKTWEIARLNSRVGEGELQSKEFFESLNKVLPMPSIDLTTSIKITAKPDSITGIVITAAIPSGALNFLSEYSVVA